MTTAIVEESLMTCRLCGKQLPLFDGKGQHNFCPAIFGGNVINLCIDCKVAMGTTRPDFMLIGQATGAAASVSIGPMMVCPLCTKQLPQFNDEGQHNFCPAIFGGKVVNLCIACKMSAGVKGGSNIVGDSVP